jgi:PadR family transcriptional regulator, regulatory protein PadR
MAKARKDEGEREISGSECFMREGPGKRFIEPRVLFLLNRGPSYGYELAANMEDVPLPGPVPDTAAVYRKLRAFEEQGFTVSEWQDQDSGPRRRVYRITPAGGERLGAWVEAIRNRNRMLERFIDLCEEEM